MTQVTECLRAGERRVKIKPPPESRALLEAPPFWIGLRATAFGHAGSIPPYACNPHPSRGYFGDTGRGLSSPGL